MVIFQLLLVNSNNNISGIIISRIFQTGTTQTRCMSQDSAAEVHPMVPDTKRKGRQWSFVRRPWFQMDAMSICRCSFWRQMLCGFMGLCHIFTARKLGCIILLYFFRWIFVQDNELLTGRIVEILANEISSRAVIALDVFQILSTRHMLFGMPMLARRYEEPIYTVIPSTVCVFYDSL